MCECQWEPLAEIDLYFEQDNSRLDKNIYCLCSRVFIRNGLDSTNKTELSSYENESNEEKVVEKELLTEQNLLTSIKDVDSTVSCYCSASHTDNISADEHDSLRSAPPLSRGLHSSDSGADLSESFVEQETWQQFWSHNGEKLIWTSWINKYSNYINPDYLETDNSDQQNSEETLQSNNETKFSFNKSDIVKIIEENSDVRKLSDQSKLGEGWNPLSPASVDGGHHSQEDELLLNTRSGSIYSATHTRVTSDSMTNVTKMTLSSLDISSESTSSSTQSSISDSISPMQNSLMSSSSESENDPGTTIDADQYWQYLWKHHFEEQYYEHYMKFLARKQTEKINSDSAQKSDLINKRKVRREIKTLNSVGYLLHNLKVMDEEDESFVRDNTAEVQYIADKFENDKTVEKRDSNVQTSDEDEKMAQLGLPSQFGRQSNVSPKHHKDAESKNSASKRSYDSENDDSSSGGNVSDRLSGAFSLMGYVWSPDNSINGNVVFRKKHIRLQNRQLKMKHLHNSPPMPKHTYFDDDGNPVNDDAVNMPKQNEIPTTDHVLPIELVSSSDDEQQTDLLLKSRSAQIKKSSSGCECNTTSLVSSDTINLTVDSTSSNKLLTSDTTSNNSKSNELIEEDFHESLEEIIERSRIYAGRRQKNTDTAASVELVDDVMHNIIMEVDKSSDCDTNSILKRKEKKKKKRTKKTLTTPIPSIVIENPELKKYWLKRFQLFNKFDQGILLDYESWFSVTPERVAKYIAERCSCNIIVDAFCGAGGNTIQFALTCQHVIAIDIDPEKIKLAEHNAQIYGVSDRIEFILGDYTKIYHQLKADVVFLSPPWGGPNYLKSDKYDLETMLEPVPLSELMTTSRHITKNVAVFVPRNSNTTQLAILAEPGGKVEIEQNFLDKSFVSLTAFYGSLINSS